MLIPNAHLNKQTNKQRIKKQPAQPGEAGWGVVSEKVFLEEEHLSLLGGTEATRKVPERDKPELSYQDRDQRG